MSAISLSPDRIPVGVSDVAPLHSNVSFEVRHMRIATGRGSFRRFAQDLLERHHAQVLAA